MTEQTAAAIVFLAIGLVAFRIIVSGICDAVKAVMIWWGERCEADYVADGGRNDMLADRDS